MIHLPAHNAVFIRTPKTGTMFVSSVLRSLDVEWYERSVPNLNCESYRYARNWLGLKVKIFTFIRHPTSWLQSFWAGRMLVGGDWGGDLQIGHQCGSRDFNRFAMNVVNNYPGWVGEFFSHRIEEPPNRSGLVTIGKQENLVYDLYCMLTSLGIEISLESLRAKQRINRSATRKGYQKLVRYKTKVLERVTLAESLTIRRFYT